MTVASGDARFAVRKAGAGTQGAAESHLHFDLSWDGRQVWM